MENLHVSFFVKSAAVKLLVNCIQSIPFSHTIKYPNRKITKVRGRGTDMVHYWLNVGRAKMCLKNGKYFENCKQTAERCKQIFEEWKKLPLMKS